ncbi:zinc finger, CCHC-type containing protein [Tanacetum coccineum]
MITPYELWTKRKPNLNYLRVWGCRAVVRLPDLKLKTLGERGIECIFVGYAEHSKAFRFYVIEPNDSVSINSIIESRDAIFDENRFSSVPRPSLKIPNGPNDIVVQLVLKRSHEVVDVLFGKKQLMNEMDSIMGTTIGCLADLPLGCNLLGCKWISKEKLKYYKTVDCYGINHNLIIHQMDVKIAFLNGDLDEEVDLTKEFLSSRFSIKDMGEVDVILGIRIKHESNGIAISQSYYIKKVLKKFNYFDLGKLSRYTSNPGTQHWQAIQRVLKYLKKTMDYRLTYTGYPSVLEGYTDASWISNTEDNSSTSGWVFLLGGGAISWASKKQTCITGSTMESEFVALAAAGKEAEWLKNLLLEIPLWSKPIAPISIRCDSVATLAKAYSRGVQRYSNGLKGSILRTP